MTSDSLGLTGESASYVSYSILLTTWDGIGMTRDGKSTRAAGGGVTIDSPAKRARLPARRNPFWVSCGAQRGGLSLGYRKPKDGPGAWIARLIVDQHRHEERLGEADDEGAAPTALSYAVATAAAMDWGRKRVESLQLTRSAIPVTLRQAITTYVSGRKEADWRNGRDAETRLEKHLLAEPKGMAERMLAGIAERQWKDWRAGLTGMSASTVDRLVNDVKAAMHRAWDDHHGELPLGWREMLERGLRAPPSSRCDDQETASGHREYLPERDVRGVIGAAFEVELDFGYLTLVLGATGARFSQAKRVTVADVVPGAEPRIMVPPSRKGGKGARKTKRIACQVGADVITALTPLLAGRHGHERLLMRWHHEQFPGCKAEGRAPEWRPVRRVPWNNAADMARQWKETLRRAGLPEAIEPYRLRDASIIRGLREGLPLELVARLHDTSEGMIRKHYAIHIDDALSEMARRAVVPLAPIQPAKLRAVG